MSSYVRGSSSVTGTSRGEQPANSVGLVRRQPAAGVGRFRRFKLLGPPLSLAILAGVCCGLGLAWLLEPTAEPSHTTAIQYVEFPNIDEASALTSIEPQPPQSQTQIVVPAPVSSSVDVEAVKTRNRRLEALVKVLQRRTVEERKQQSQRAKN